MNLSFLPRSFWGVDARPHTHFVGCGEQERSARRSEILVTLGNTFPPAHRARVIEALRAASASVGGPWHFLGEGIWEPYPVAFARARLAVGHGGNIFLWQAMAEGIPVIAISGGRADQAFGARAVERLGIGTAISLHEASAERIAEAIRTLLADGQAESRARRMHRILRSGGGVAAAVRLLEALAEQCTAVEQCVPDGCCCREAAEAF